MDYSAGLVHDAMTNTSDFFSDARALTNESLRASERLRLTADQLVVSFPEADLPAQAFNLSVQSMRYGGAGHAAPTHGLSRADAARASS